jgi:oligoendopeptidase F
MNIFKMKQSLILLAVILLVNTMDGYSQKTRDEISDKYKWNLTDLFPNEEAWRDALNNIKGRLNEVESFKGTLTKSAANLLKALEYNSEISKAASKLSSYASMNSDLDTRNMKYSAMKQELQQLFASFGAKSAFMDPEILSTDWETIDGFIKQEPKLEVYRKGLTNMFKIRSIRSASPKSALWPYRDWLPE